MICRPPGLGSGTTVLDLGAGYGGSARHLAAEHGCLGTCLNISEAQNDTNRSKNRQAGLEERIRVVHGSFDDIPEPASSFDVVWSQDSLLNAPDGVLQPVYERLNLSDLGCLRFYREAALALGFEVVEQVDLVYTLRTHYERVRQELEARRSELEQQSSRVTWTKCWSASRTGWLPPTMASWHWHGVSSISASLLIGP